MKKLLTALALASAMLVGTNASALEAKPTIVLVHGAFADASSWNGVITILEKDGYPVVAAANPLRGVRIDAHNVSDLLAGMTSPVVLVGHSYGGNVITDAANGHANVKALVYVSAFAPDAGETAAGLTGKFPGSTFGPTLAPPVKLSDGGGDLYIQQDKFHDQFAADVPEAQAALMSATQRPVTESALNEPTSQPAWKTIPSWFIYGTADRNIPPPAMTFMAKRAHAREVQAIKGASHVVMVSNPAPVARLIERAADAK